MLFDEYFNLQKQIFTYFGYDPQWEQYPIEDNREMFWLLDEKRGTVCFAEIVEKIDTDDCYDEEGLTLKWVYPGEEYTMLCVDTQTDGNKLLRIFDNKKRENWRERDENIYKHG